MMRTMIKKPLMYLAALAVGALSVTLPAHADNHSDGPMLIQGGIVHTMGTAGRLVTGDVLIEDGKIAAVGRTIAPPQGAKVINAKNKVVTPGLMTSYSALGLVEVSAVRETRDDLTARQWRNPLDLDVRYSFNPGSTLIPITRLEGITRAITSPRGGDIISGRAAAVHLGHGPDLITDIHVGIFANMAASGRESRAIKWAKLIAALTRVRKDGQQKPFAQSPLFNSHAGHTDSALGGLAAFVQVNATALEPVIKGDLPLVMFVHRESDIRNALKLAEEHKFRLILAGAREAWRVADEIAAAGVPVIVNPLDNLPSRFQGLAARLDNAARLQRAGVMIAFSVFDTHQERLLPQLAGNAVANGLDYPAALAAMTVNPAKIWGLNERYGTLEVGKDADVVIWDGDPLEVTTSPDMVFIQGKAVPMESRQTKLRDRYKDLTRGALPLQYQ